MACPATGDPCLSREWSYSHKPAVIPGGLWSLNKGLQLAPSICINLHGNEQRKLNTHMYRGWEYEPVQGRSCQDEPRGLPLNPLSAGHHDNMPQGRRRTKLSPLSQHRVLAGVCSPHHPAWHQHPRAQQLEGQEHAWHLLPLCHGVHTAPSHQSRAPLYLPTATTSAFTLFFLQTSKGWASTDC